MRKKLKNLLEDQYFRNSAIFFVGSLLVAFINYVYYPILSRMLAVEDFGAIQTIATLILQSTIILNAFGYVAIHLFSNMKTGDESAEKAKNLEGAALLITSVAILIALVFSKQIDSYLKFDSIIPLAAICVIFLLNVPFTIKNSWLQAKHKFIDVSIGAAISAIAKLLFAVIFIALGFTVTGAVWGLIIATLLTLAYVSYKSNTEIRFFDHLSTNYFSKIAVDKQLQKDLLFGLSIFLTLISITFLYSADVVFVRRYFDTITAGYYSGIAAIARIIFFATFAFSAVLLPSIKIDSMEDNFGKLVKAIIITLAIGAAGLAVFYLLPNLTVSILIGAKYLSFAKLLPSVGLFVLLASVTNVLLVYLIALRQHFVAVIGLLGAVMTICLVTVSHSSVESIVWCFTIANLATLVLSIGYLWFHQGKIAKL